MASLMFLDDVIRSHRNTPIPQGISLYRMLKEKGRVLILCKDKDKDEIWLRQNKINLIDDLIGEDVPLVTDNLEWRQVEYCRSQWTIDMVVTGDPEMVKRLLEAGVTTLMFLQPTYISEKFRPDSRQGIKPWAEITKEIIHQQESYVEDHRID